MTEVLDATTFHPTQPKQKLLLPSDLGDWLPKGHMPYEVTISWTNWT